MKKRIIIFLGLFLILSANVSTESWIDDVVVKFQKTITEKFNDTDINCNNLVGTYWVPFIPLTDADVISSNRAYSCLDSFVFINKSKLLRVKINFIIDPDFLSNEYKVKNILDYYISIWDSSILEYTIKNDVIKLSRYEMTLKDNKLYVKNMRTKKIEIFILAKIIDN